MAKEIDTLIEKLKRKGEELSGTNIANSINNIAYRLLEQVRLGNKDYVFYLLIRCFKANEEKFPNELVETFKNENDKYFKTLIFSFLAPILGKEKEVKNERCDNNNYFI
ncbi:MAG: hypothetical protein RMJ34_06115 [candidate division WOR-3 bacterium]|nr:hypothetical protein [candidate division WOR-3 bacterium]